jgi:hypothetical protein
LAIKQAGSATGILRIRNGCLRAVKSLKNKQWRIGFVGDVVSLE